MSEFPKDHPGAVTAQNIANQFYELLCVVGGVNYVEVQFDDIEHPGNPSIAILVQKVGAITPAEKAKQLVSSNRVVKERLCLLRNNVGALSVPEIIAQLDVLASLIQDK